MYIPEFFCGIIFTILVEIAICIIVVIMLRKGDKRKADLKKDGIDE